MRCGEGPALLSRLRCSGPRLFCMERALRCARFQPSGVPPKRGTKSCTCVFCLPRPSGSGSQELHPCTLPGCGSLLPSASPAPVLARASRVPVPCVSQPPSQQMSTIQNLRKSLVRNWRPVCSVVGDAVFGAEFAPSPPPAFCLQRGWAGPQPASSSGLAQTLCTANGRQCVQAGQFSLSLLLSHSLSWYLTKAPSDCPQGTQARSLP